MRGSTARNAGKARESTTNATTVSSPSWTTILSGGNERTAEEEQRDGTSADDEDDDAAPEAISTAWAAARAKAYADKTRQEVKEQAAAKKRKRQERDRLYNKQADTRRTTAAATTAIAAAASAPGTASGSAVRTPASPTTEAATAPSDRGERWQTTSKGSASLPDMLPADVLAQASDEEGEAKEKMRDLHKKETRRAVATEAGALEAVERRLAKGPRPARDMIVGQTVWRISRPAQDDKLPPCASKRATILKIQLLRRKRTARPRPLRK